jgi:hypothetical protein
MVFKELTSRKEIEDFSLGLERDLRKSRKEFITPVVTDIYNANLYNNFEFFITFSEKKN